MSALSQYALCTYTSLVNSEFCPSIRIPTVSFTWVRTHLCLVLLTKCEVLLLPQQPAHDQIPQQLQLGFSPELFHTTVKNCGLVMLVPAECNNRTCKLSEYVLSLQRICLIHACCCQHCPEKDHKSTLSPACMSSEVRLLNKNLLQHACCLKRSHY